MERRIDNLGRVVIPRKILEVLSIEVNSVVYLGGDDECIYVSKEYVTGFIKTKVDNVGRVNIPVEHRRKLSMPTSSIVEIEVDYDVITIKRSPARCLICGANENILDVKGVRLCNVEEIKVGTFWSVE